VVLRVWVRQIGEIGDRTEGIIRFEADFHSRGRERQGEAELKRVGKRVGTQVLGIRIERWVRVGRGFERVVDG
jgi:hypothetical protein